MSGKLINNGDELKGTPIDERSCSERIGAQFESEAKEIVDDFELTIRTLTDISAITQLERETIQRIRELGRKIIDPEERLFDIDKNERVGLHILTIRSETTLQLRLSGVDSDTLLWLRQR